MEQTCQVSERMRHRLRTDGHQGFTVRNYLAHSLEGAAYMGGLAFLAGETVGAQMLAHLGAPSWLQGTIPALLLMGFVLPALFTAHIIERRQRMMPFLLGTGVPQRLPFLLGGLALWWADALPSWLVLLCVVLVPVASGLCGGIGAAAWFELTAKILPPQRRSSALALRAALGAFIGLFAAEVVEEVLARWPGTRGYAILHFLTFGFLVLSYLIFSLQREVADTDRTVQVRRGLRDHLRGVPALLRSQPQIMHIVCMRWAAFSLFLLVPHLGAEARWLLALPASAIGALVASQMLGALFGSLVGGWIGDRFGPRVQLRGAYGLYLVLLLGVLGCTQMWHFQAVFLLWGAAFGMDQGGTMALGLAACPRDRRPTAMALLQLGSAPGMLLCGLLGGPLFDLGYGSEPAALLAFVAVVGALILLQRLPLSQK